MQVIDREQLQELMRRGVPVLEVLPEAEYNEEHITGAINLPLKKLDREAVAGFERDKPIAVYCDSYT